MHIESFTDHPQHLEFVVRDGARQAVAIVGKQSGKVDRCEAVGGADATSCWAFADEVATWLNANMRPKYISRAATAA